MTDNQSQMNAPDLNPDLKLKHTIHICPDYTDGIGTEGQPYGYPRVDHILQHIPDETVVRFKPGVYPVNSIRLPNRSALICTDGKAIIRQIPNYRTSGNWPHVRTIRDSNWCHLFYAYGLIVDGNYPQFDFGTVAGNSKVSPLVVKTVVGKVENCEVLNFGANGAGYGNQGLECFPLAMETISNGPPRHYEHRYLSLMSERTSFLEITDCKVHSPHFSNGGYCTGIFVKTNQPASGDRQEFGIRDTWSARIHNNEVEVPGGIAYGVAWAEKVVFERNRAVRSKCAFNLDTGKARHLIIRDNQFIEINQGVNVSVPCHGMMVRDNVFEMTEPFFNRVTNKTEDFYAVRHIPEDSSEISGNLIVADWLPSLIIDTKGKFLSETGNRVHRPMRSELSDSTALTDCQVELDKVRRQLLEAETSEKELKGEVIAQRVKITSLKNQEVKLKAAIQNASEALGEVLPD